MEESKDGVRVITADNCVWLETHGSSSRPPGSRHCSTDLLEKSALCRDQVDATRSLCSAGCSRMPDTNTLSAVIAYFMQAMEGQVFSAKRLSGRQGLL